MCCEDLCIVNVTLRQPLPKRQKKAAMQHEFSIRDLENNFCGMNFWGISDYWLHSRFCPWQKTCHRVTRWKSEMEWNVFALFGSQPLATNCSHLAIKRRWISVWREACMSRCISCRVLQVSLVFDVRVRVRGLCFIWYTGKFIYIYINKAGRPHDTVILYKYCVGGLKEWQVLGHDHWLFFPIRSQPQVPSSSSKHVDKLSITAFKRLAQLQHDPLNHNFQPFSTWHSEHGCNSLFNEMLLDDITDYLTI